MSGRFVFISIHAKEGYAFHPISPSFLCIRGRAALFNQLAGRTDRAVADIGVVVLRTPTIVFQRANATLVVVLRRKEVPVIKGLHGFSMLTERSIREGIRRLAA
jgi:hypothetical protein